MISDSFWTDPELVGLTAEDRTCLLLFLTNNDSNIIGVYRTVWRVIGAGPGWTQEQILNVARDLASKNLLEIDEANGWIWVKEWWKHNSLRGAFLGNVKNKALKELANVPSQWKSSVFEWLLCNDEDGSCGESLNSLRVSGEVLRSPFGAPPKPLTSPLEGSGGNHTYTSNLISTTTDNTGASVGGALLSFSLDEMMSAAIWATKKTKKINNLSGYMHTVRLRLEEQGPNATDFATLQAWRTENETIKARTLASRQTRALELKAEEQASNARLAAEIEIKKMSPSELDQLMEAFLASNEHLRSRFKKDGLGSKIVYAALVQFYIEISEQSA